MTSLTWWYSAIMLWWQKKTQPCFTATKEALSSSEGEVSTVFLQAISSYVSSTLFSSVGVQCKIIMGKPNIKQELDLAGGKHPVPVLWNEIQEWQESPKTDGLFTCVSEFPLMFLGICKISDISSHQVATVECCLQIWDSEIFPHEDKWFHSQSHWSTSSSG